LSGAGFSDDVVDERAFGVRFNAQLLFDQRRIEGVVASESVASEEKTRSEPDDAENKIATRNVFHNDVLVLELKSCLGAKTRLKRSSRDAFSSISAIANAILSGEKETMLSLKRRIENRVFRKRETFLGNERRIRND